MFKKLIFHYERLILVKFYPMEVIMLDPITISILVMVSGSFATSVGSLISNIITFRQLRSQTAAVTFRAETVAQDVRGSTELMSYRRLDPQTNTDGRDLLSPVPENKSSSSEETKTNDSSHGGKTKPKKLVHSERTTTELKLDLSSTDNFDASGRFAQNNGEQAHKQQVAQQQLQQLLQAALLPQRGGAAASGGASGALDNSVIDANQLLSMSKQLSQYHSNMGPHSEPTTAVHRTMRSNSDGYTDQPVTKVPKLKLPADYKNKFKHKHTNDDAHAQTHNKVKVKAVAKKAADDSAVEYTPKAANKSLANQDQYNHHKKHKAGYEVATSSNSDTEPDSQAYEHQLIGDNADSR